MSTRARSAKEEAPRRAVSKRKDAVREEGWAVGPWYGNAAGGKEKSKKEGIKKQGGRWARGMEMPPEGREEEEIRATRRVS